MKPEIKKCLYDIKRSIENIYEYIGSEQDFKKFQDSKLIRRAVEREIEIIGEATSRILRYDDKFILTNSRKIIDTRNWVIHGYDKVDEFILWGIITDHLPKLLDEVSGYLGNNY